MTNMTDLIKALFKKQNIDLVSAIGLEDCTVTRPHKLKNAGYTDTGRLSAIIFAVPYLSPSRRRNISAYAVSRDYHGYFKSLFDEIIPILKSNFPENSFAGFADDSPIDERIAAAKAGLGILGDNGMLITEKYSSYVFLGEIITDLPLDTQSLPIKRCMSCGKCLAACPKSDIGQCLSALTQKKGELSTEESAHIAKYGSAWGCDRCQEVCPHTLRAIKNQTIYTNIDFFKKDLIPMLSSELIEKMDDDEFSKRAYSWRKRETIQRNLKITEEISN
jgi:epoxyqueuosine reductase